MDNQNNSEIIYETTNVQEEIEKKISFARRAIAGNIPMVSPHAAVPSLNAAIELGSSEAKGILAGYYYNSKGEDRNYEEAFRLATESAEEGDPEGQTILGRILLEGRAANRDNDRAFHLLSEAAEKGNAEAQFLLGSCYYDGIGTEKDLYAARDCYQKAVAGGQTFAATVLNGLEKIINEKESYDAAASKAKSGDLDSMISLGKEFYKKAVQAKEYDPALYNEAENWLQMAAKKEDPESQYLLYECYTADESNAADREKKKEYRLLRERWLEEAALFSKYPEAIYTLARHRQSGTLYDKDPGVAFKYFKYAAESGHPDSMSALSSCYERGDGVTEDIDMAIEWAVKAYEAKTELGEVTFLDEDRIRDLNKLKRNKEQEEAAAKIKQIEEAEKLKQFSYLWSDISFNVYGILAAVALCLLMLFYRALGSGLFGRPLINVHGLGGLFLKAICFAGIFFSTFVSLLSLLSQIGLEFFAAYPGALMVLALAVGIKETSPFYKYLSYAAGAVIAINLLIIIIKAIIYRK